MGVSDLLGVSASEPKLSSTAEIVEATDGEAATVAEDVVVPFTEAFLFRVLSFDVEDFLEKNRGLKRVNIQGWFLTYL